MSHHRHHYHLRVAAPIAICLTADPECLVRGFRETGAAIVPIVGAPPLDDAVRCVTSNHGTVHHDGITSFERLSTSLVDAPGAVAGCEVAARRVQTAVHDTLRRAVAPMLAAPETELSYLESFRTYDARSANYTMELHTDEGVLLAFVPAAYDNDGADDGFVTRRGDRLFHVPAHARESVVLMPGEAWGEFLRPAVDATPHMVLTSPGSRRYWYGSMLKATHPDRHPTCTSRRVLFDQSGCADNHLLCWHRCMPVTDACDSSPPQCLDSAGEAWKPGDPHCTDCMPRCDDAHEATAEPFCTGPGTDMLMGGFEFHPSDCIIFLVAPLVLDTATKFVVALVATLALGVCAEFLTFFRRTRLAKAKLARRTRVATMTCVFMTQLTVGYALMLVAMTYRGELFIAVILGIGLGHAMFNVYATPGESIEPCCIEPVSAQTYRSFQIEPIVCNGCVAECKSAIGAVPGVDAIDMQMDGRVNVAGTFANADVIQRIHQIGKQCRPL